MDVLIHSTRSKMNKEELRNMIRESKGNESNICQIFAYKDGREESVFLRDGYKDSDSVHVASVTKGIMALLTGIAIDKGLIPGVDEKVLSFFPEYKVKKGEKTIFDVTVRHLLTMTAPYKYRSEPWTKVCTSQDWTYAALDLLGGRGGITGEFKYSTLGIQILAGIIERASDEKLIDFANENLFSPLGIPKHQIHGTSSKEDQFDYLMNKRPRKNEWFSDPKDTVTAGWGLCLSARDLARIGTMILSGGQFEGNRIVSEEWIDMMTTPYLKLGERFGSMSYGFLWYRPFEGRDAIAAIGDGGNVIYVNKELGVSVGVTGTFKPRIFDRVEFIEKYVMPLLYQENPVFERNGANT